MIVLAGATGDLGGRIAAALVRQGGKVRAVARHGAAQEKLERLRQLGVDITVVDYASSAELASACSGGACLVSALAGLREVIFEAQSRLLAAAVSAGVPRFIPSDYCIDYTKLRVGSNRNLDVRREFNARLDEAPIRATSVLGGMFADMLTGVAPIILFKYHRILYWHDADQPLDFTVKDDVAAYTAAVALDPSTPRLLRVAGDTISARDLATIMSELNGRRFRLLRAGGLGSLGAMIKVARTLFPGRNQLYPPWQGMQYLHNMFSGAGKLQPLDNARYPDLRWTSVRDMLAERSGAGH